MAKFLKIGIFSSLTFCMSFGIFIFSQAQQIPFQEGQVYVCPFATKIEEVNPRCDCRIDLILGEEVEKECDGKIYKMTLTITEYEGKEYYAILGFENGGAGVNLEPKANTGGPYQGYVNQEILFDGSNSSDQNGDPLDFYWDFGDGNFATGSKVSHAYQKSGDYLVILTVFDGMASSSATTTAKISSPPAIISYFRSFVKKEISQIPQPSTSSEEIEKIEIPEKLSPPEIVEIPTQPEIQVEKPKIAGIQKIEPAISPSLFASLIEVFKEKPFLLFLGTLSIFSLLIFLFFKIKTKRK